MFVSRSGLFLALLLMVSVGACMSRSINPPTASFTSTATMPSLPTATPIRPTWTPFVLPPSPTAFVPSVPDDKRIIASIDVGGAPGTMVVENGLLWVIAHNTVVRIDPQTDQVAGKPISVPVPDKAELPAIAVGQDAVWVSIVGGGDIDRPSPIDSVLRLDPLTGETVATIKVPRGPMSLSYTPGIVWVVNFGFSARTVSQIDSNTNQLEEERVTTGYAPYSITVGGEAVWVINHDDGTLTRIDPKTNQVIANVLLPEEPHRVAYGEGLIWIGNWHHRSVSRVDPRINQVVGEPIRIGYHTGNIAAGYGNVWVTSDYRGAQAFPAPFSDHTFLIRIDPETNQVIDTIPLGGFPVDVKMTENAVWVSIQNPDFVLKIRP